MLITIEADGFGYQVVVTNPNVPEGERPYRFLGETFYPSDRGNAYDRALTDAADWEAKFKAAKVSVETQVVKPA